MQKTTAAHKLYDIDHESKTEFCELVSLGGADRDIDILFTLFRGETSFELNAYKKY